MEPISKRAFLERLRTERIEWLALLDRADPAWRDEPGVVGKWSLRELVAHIGVWEAWGANVVRAVTDGGDWTDDALLGLTIPPQVAALDFDPFNEWLTDQHAAQPYAQVAAYEERAYQDFIAAFEALDESWLSKQSREFSIIERFGDDRLSELLANQTYEHWREHAASVRAWLTPRRPLDG